MGILPGLPCTHAQDTTSVKTDTSCVQQDLSDVVRSALNKPPKAKKPQAGSLLLLPIIGSNPATGFMIGVGGQYAFQMPESTQYSLISGSIQYTTQNQFIFMLKNSVYSKRNRFFHTGDWRFLIFSQSTYGLGTNSPEGGVLDYQYNLGGIETTSDSQTQPMEFNFVRLHQSLGLRITPGMYLGLGYQFDSYFKIVDLKLKLTPGDSVITSHYFYNTHYGFDTDKYYNSAVSARFVIDKRDNMIRAYKGYYLLVGWRGAFEFIGNRNNTNLFQFEWRSFHNVSKRNASHLVAFWLMGDFSLEGDLPYMILPATAYDQRGRSARGYTQGRFRGKNMMYGEAEYRFPISRCSGVLGGVLFANATTATNQGQSLELFESVKPSFGFGLRVMADRHSRTNLAIDFGFGDKSSGFYLAASETF
jgi:outer membrane protein assembly factor BamA